MQLTPLRILVALLCVTTFLFIEWALNGTQKSCGNRLGQEKQEEFNYEEFKKRDRVPGKDLFRLFDDVKTFVMFIGYPRSGHSLIGSLLDAHPEIVIPHQYDVFAHWEMLADSMLGLSTDVRKYKLFYDLFSLSEEQALFGKRSPNCTLSTYCYHVPSGWQGTFVKQIRVIGDKRGGETSAVPPAKLLSFFTELERTFKVPLRLIHVVRNPFDNIATIALRYNKYRDEVRNANSERMNNSEALDRSIAYYFQRANTNREVLARRGNIVLNIKSHDTIQRPRETIQKLCDHLRVTCYPDFVDACVDTLFNKLSVTRNTVVWTDNQKERVRREIKSHSFLQDFTFEDVP